MNPFDPAELARTLLEESGDALFLFDPDTEDLLEANPMAQRLSGFTRQELLRLRITYLFRAETQGGLQRLRHAYQRTGAFHSQEGFLLRQKQDGVWVPVNLTVSRLHAEPRTLGLVTARDIRERRAAQALQKKTEIELQKVLAASSVCLWTAEADAAGNLFYRYVSPAVERVTGRSPEYFAGAQDRWLALVHPEDRQRVEESFARAMTSHLMEASSEYRMIRPDGGVCWVRDAIQIQRGAEGRPVRLDGALTDITEGKQAESLQSFQKGILEKIATGSSLAEVLDYLVRILEGAAPDLLASILLLKENRLWHGAAPSLPDDYNRAVHGIAIGPDVGSCGTAAFLGKTVVVEDIAHDPLWANFRDLALGHGLQACWSTPILSQSGNVLGTFALYSRRPRGPAPHEQRVVEVASHLAAIAIERTRAEEALRESEERYRFLFAGNPHPMFVFDLETLRYLEVNEAAVLSYGYSRDEFLEMTVKDIRPPEDIPALIAAVNVLGPVPYRSGVWRHRKKDGAIIYADIVTRPVTYDGRPARLSVAHDVTERRRAEDALRASEEKYRFLIDSLEQCIILKDAELRFVAANRTFCAGLGLDETEILGKTDFDLYPVELAEKYRADDRAVLAEGKRVEIEEQNPLNGQLCTVRVIKTPARDTEGRTTGVLGIFWDVTQQRELEARLRQAQKMEAVGLLAGGIAHDFNNLLTAILGNLSLLLNDLPNPHPGRELAAAAERASLRAADLTRQLLGFSRRTLLRPQPADLNSTVAEVVAILRRTIDPRIGVEILPHPDLWTVKADPGQLSQVLMNLCLNARDAMPDGGRLILETANAELTPSQARLHVEARPGEYVRLSVTDTGCGITPEIQPRIFEPFFTTKGPGKGTGLGLAMVFGIVQQHEGWIECQSEPGRGTTFSLYIPRLQDGLLAPSTTHTGSTDTHGRETVLLVDDEEMIRSLGRTILERYGYEVLLAEDGQEAVEVYQRERDRIDLVILDLTMPRLSGHDAFRQLRDIDPGVRVLFASGYSAEHLTADDPERVLGFVGKPYRPRELAQSVRSALERARGAERETRESGNREMLGSGHTLPHPSANGGCEAGGGAPP